MFHRKKTDGTIDGTQLLIDLYPGINGSYSFEFAQINAQVIFNGDNGHIGAELWSLGGLCLLPTNLNLDGVLSSGIYQQKFFIHEINPRRRSTY